MLSQHVCVDITLMHYLCECVKQQESEEPKNALKLFVAYIRSKITLQRKKAI